MDPLHEPVSAETQYSLLVIKVHGRDALPVRAIPFVTDWVLSPDVVAKNFARKARRGFEKLQNTETYELRDGQIFHLDAEKWGVYVVALEGLDAELKRQFPESDRGFDAWLTSSVAKLPAGVFVWLEEFKADVVPDHSERRARVVGENACDPELSFSPYLENDVLNMVLEGFESRAPILTHRDDDIAAGLEEKRLNGHRIDWPYWVEKTPTLTSGEAARLMNGLDPNDYADLTARPIVGNDPSQACIEAGRIERIAKASGDEPRASKDWYEWALVRGIKVHRGFFLAANGRYLREHEAEVLAAMPRAEASRWEQAPALGFGKRLVSINVSRRITEVTFDFPDFCEEVYERLARWRRGRYTLTEAAQVIANLGASIDPELLAQLMDAAIRSGKLAFRLNSIRVPPAFVPEGALWNRDMFADDVNAWLATESAGSDARLMFPYQDDEGPAQTPEQRGSVQISESSSGGTVEKLPDSERRLALLRELGGSVKLRHGEWRFTGIKALVASEKAARTGRSDEKTIRADLREACQAERDAKTAGHWQQPPR
jgi:hypothetical protein